LVLGLCTPKGGRPFCGRLLSQLMLTNDRHRKAIPPVLEMLTTQSIKQLIRFEIVHVEFSKQGFRIYQATDMLTYRKDIVPRFTFAFAISVTGPIRKIIVGSYNSGLYKPIHSSYNYFLPSPTRNQRETLKAKFDVDWPACCNFKTDINFYSLFMDYFYKEYETVKEL